MMTQAKKLEALLDYARKNDVYHLLKGCEVRTHTVNGESEVYIYQTYGVDKQFYRELAWQQVLYNHEVARALLGDKEIDLNYELGNAQYKLFTGTIFSSIGTLPAFQAHLMLAVISNDPIDYFYRAVFGDE